MSVVLLYIYCYYKYTARNVDYNMIFKGYWRVNLKGKKMTAKFTL